MPQANQRTTVDDTKPTVHNSHSCEELKQYPHTQRMRSVVQAATCYYIYRWENLVTAVNFTTI